MNSIVKYFGYFIATVFLVLALVFLVQNCSMNKKYLLVKAERDSCWAVKHTIDTVHDTIHYTDYKEKLVFKPKLVRVEVPDSIPDVECDSIKMRYYSVNTYADSFGNSDFNIQYGVTVTENGVQKFFVPSYKVFRKTIYDKKVVDTCLFKTQKVKNRLFLFARMGTDFVHFSSAGVGLHWEIKNIIMLSPGVTFYDFYANKPSFDLAVGIKIK